ncbi:hypothetical protein PTNB73_04107 [Pyrenophora teres f. teres]|uniref:Cupin type-2 domain-containing protein n=1 Tax=Pyrenophora teres f. teres TaxID=97479 RepID=A0A6S6VPB8_9PLEO|nr:hypothetical protein HRS9139_04244 [Pyrenophora teres f. teres]KAE8837885.1 hypothetical protein PTNB85_05220 [Pyrenophora teres f. teres]KAE8839695.1 hypothetical protein HRS9122_06300 [Pyrenophora teres f. teres]KAE8862708.1 hypothetical protein PTNB29_05270 [Pyrenophora teres f. teres]KAE8869054.1 hypothetical protein PTNB73_04107 [Pyrenophora teres f. teres]
MLKPTSRLLQFSPKPLALPLRQHRNFSTSIRLTATAKPKMDAYKKIGNREDAPPKHEMVHFAGLLSEKRSQLVAMEIPPHGEIGDEVHTVDQILLFTSGRGLATVAGKNQEVKAGDVVVVPAGTQHQFVTQGEEPLELITVYSPAEHLPSSVHKTKEAGDKAEEDGVDEAPAWAGRGKSENEKAGLVRESGKYE